MNNKKKIFGTTMLINIKEKEYEFCYGWGALYLFEATAPNQKFNPKNHAQLHLMYYCVLMNSNKGMNLTQEEFIEALDTQQGLSHQLDEAFNAELKRWSDLQGYTEGDKKKEENL